LQRAGQKHGSSGSIAKDLSQGLLSIRVALIPLLGTLSSVAASADRPMTKAALAGIAMLAAETRLPPAFERLLNDLLRVLGPNHPDTLATRCNLARLREQAEIPPVRTPH
jgi:hypothetical protein